MDGRERFLRFHPFSNFLVQNNAHRRIDGIFLALSPSTENHAGGADLFALHGGNDARFRAEYLRCLPRLQEPRRVINDSRVAAL